MKRLPSLALALLLLVATSFVASGARLHSRAALAAPAEYEVIAVDGYGGAVAINNRRQVALDHGFWEDGLVTPYGTLGGATTDAVDMNERGQVVGTSRDANGQRHAFLWEDGVMVNLTPEGSEESSTAHAINDHGEVLLTTDGLGSQPPRSWVWSHGNYRQLPIRFLQAFGLNNRGEAIGEVLQPRAAVVVDTRRGKVTYFPYSGPVRQFFGISERGEVVGSMAEPICGQPGAFGATAMRITEDGPSSLNVPKEPCNSTTIARGVNNQGVIVGESFGGAWIWEDGETSFLPSAGDYWQASDINDRGDVVGITAGPVRPPFSAVIWLRRD
jgi:probable HAF family extracellular repeat protein